MAVQDQEIQDCYVMLGSTHVTHWINGFWPYRPISDFEVSPYDSLILLLCVGSSTQWVDPTQFHPYEDCKEFLVAAGFQHTFINQSLGWLGFSLPLEIDY